MSQESNPIDGEKSASSNPIVLAAVGIASLAICAAGGWALRGLRSDATVAAPPSKTPAAATEPQPHARGRLVFQVHCARCHGPGGKGDGPDAASLHPPPRNLTTAPWRTVATADSVRRTVREGIPGTMMPSLAAGLSPRELDVVVDYVLSIAPEEARSPFSPLIRKAGLTPLSQDILAPAFETRDMEGKTVTLEQLRGRLVLVVFWGTSCVPCVKELAELERLAASYRGKNFKVIPICADETDPSAVRSVAAERAPTLPVFLDPTGTVRLNYDVQSLPSATLIAPDGRWLGRSQGSMSWSSPAVTALIDALLNGSQPEPAARSAP